MGFLDRFRKKGPPSRPTAREKVEKSLQDLKKEEGGTEDKAKLSLGQAKIKENTGHAYRVLLRPVITEKSAVLADMGKYVFEVAPEANKIEVAQAVKLVYGVHPVKVNMIKLSGQKVLTRSRGFKQGRTSDKSKAIVTLKKGEKIPLFEGV